MLVLAFLLGMFGQTIPAWAQSATTAQTAVRLEGRVLSADDDATPLRGARVSVVPAGDPVLPATSEWEGRFDLLVPAGHDWTLRVTKAGYAPVDLPAADLSVAPVLIHMTRGAVITGRVVNRRGDPVRGLTVHVSPAACPDPCPPGQAPPGGMGQVIATTDDLGEYRIGSLPAGRYDVQLSAAGAAVDTARRLAEAIEARRNQFARAAARLTGTSEAAPRPLEPAATVALRAGEETTLHLRHDGEDFGPALPTPAATPREVTDSHGTIRGRVFGPSGNPEASADVQVAALDFPWTPFVTTDAEGRYEVTGLSAGSYRLRVTKAGFTPVHYGQEWAQQQGTTIVLRDGETLDRIDVRLLPGGVITGRVVDVYGEPLEGIAVSVLERRFTGGRTTVVPAAGIPPGRTDDRGQYRIYGLLPGTYYVASVADATPMVAALARGTSAMGVTAAPAQARPSPDAAPAREFRLSQGQSIVLASPTPVAGTTYHPGTAVLAEAAPVRLDTGIDAYGVDIALIPAHGARVRGVAVDSSGAPARGAASLMVSARSGVPAPPSHATPLQPDGTFEFTDVPPGDYVVQLVSQQTIVNTITDAQGRTFVNPTRGRQEFGMQFVTVTGADEVRISLRTSPGRNVEGTLVVEGDGSVNPAAFQLEAIAADPDRSPAHTQPRASPAASGAFVLTDLIGPQRLALTRAPHGWYLKSAFTQGVDAAEYPVSFDPSSATPDDIRVTVARGGDIAGRARDDDTGATLAYSAVVFSTDPTRWQYRSRYVRLARSDVNGEFAAAGLPPGEYWVAAVDIVEGDADWGEWQDPVFLGNLTATAGRVTVTAGQTVTAEPRLIRTTR